MNLQPTYNEFGSPVKFYRFQTKKSGTTYDSQIGFLAGDHQDAGLFPSLDYEKQRSIVQNHSNWSSRKPSPFISTTTDLEWALSVAKRIRRFDPIYIAEISPGRAIRGSIRYYHWHELVHELNANIEHKAKNYHEYVFLGKIPRKAITWYGTVEEYERRTFEDEEEDEDLEQEQEEEFEEEFEEDDEEEDEDKELLSLMSQLKMESDNEQEDEESEDSEVEEWYNQLASAGVNLENIDDLIDQLKMDRARTDEQEGEEETEEAINLTRNWYYNQIADLMDGYIDEQSPWGEDSEEEDFDLQSLNSLYYNNYDQSI